MRNRRNYRALWEQLKAVILYGKQQRFKREELFSLMLEMETKQAVQETTRG
jgi:hypothetical protein